MDGQRGTRQLGNATQGCTEYVTNRQRVGGEDEAETVTRVKRALGMKVGDGNESGGCLEKSF